MNEAKSQNKTEKKETISFKKGSYMDSLAKGTPKGLFQNRFFGSYTNVNYEFEPETLDIIVPKQSEQNIDVKSKNHTLNFADFSKFGNMDSKIRINANINGDEKVATESSIQEVVESNDPYAALKDIDSTSASTFF
jgi:hypothetical protein